MKKSLYAVLALALFVALAFPWPASAAPEASVIPTFSITGVVRDSTVTIYTYNFPARKSFDVLMNYMGTRGVGGYRVATINSGQGGSFSQTFDIPAAMYGQRRIAIRLQDNTGSGYYAFNWFYNNSTGASWIGGASADVKPSGPIPTFSVTVVDFDTTITVRTAHLPAGDTVRFLMGEYGTRGVGGYYAGEFNTLTGGIQEFSMPIPAELAGSDYIHVRMESLDSNYAYFAWFANQAGIVDPPPGVDKYGESISTWRGTGYWGYPIFYITGVVRNSTVTIQAHNLPANDTFNVRMAVRGNRAEGGILVTSVSSGSGGTQSFTFNIPSSLAGVPQIAIRLESPSSGYYAYNWFYNNTTNW